MAFTRYTLVGAAATSAHYALLAVLVESGACAPGWGAFWGAVLGAFVAYGGNHRYTFGSERAHAQALPRFMAVAAAGAAANGALVTTGTRLLDWHYLPVQMAATALILLLTYRLNRSWTFA